MRNDDEKSGEAVISSVGKFAWLSEFDEPVIEFAGSEMFSRLFKDGMAMVEETAAYLDGPGRSESKILPRKVALAYAGESMRLTTRLMQVASWLLVQRAIKEGEMTPEEAAEEKYRLSAHEICRGRPMDAADLLPQRLLDLLDISEKIYDRIDRLDSSMFCSPVRRGVDTVVSKQLSRLEEAFGSGAIRT
jgi:regulator of CtrA degradation